MLFIAALLCKTVTGTLPGALLVILWWQRGRLSWSKDVLPLAPWFVLGTAAAMVTAWWELEINACRGPEFSLAAMERILIAGRAVWFYLEKLLWPAHLIFSYPRWQISRYAWWQYCYPLALAALVAALWSVRRRSRAPLAALLFFCGTLVPVLGFFNLYTFRYSFVADHYQYLASLGIIALVAAAATSLLDRLTPRQRVAGRTACLALLAVLAVLSWRQCRMYADAETLYRTTIDANPDCWMAHSNLGFVLAGRGQLEEAIAHYGKALEIEPDFAETQYNLGAALAGRGQIDEAIAHYQRALQIKPDHVLAHNNLGAALAGRGQIDEAIAYYRKALEIQPDCAEAHNNLGTALVGRGQVDEAIDHYRKALEIQPEFVEAHYNLGLALAGCGQVDEAIAHYQKAVEIKPDYLVAHHKLGNVLFDRGRLDEAIASYQKVLDIKPEHAGAHNNLGLALAGRGQVDEAITHYRKALEINSDYLEAHYNLGLALAGRGRRDEALEHYDKALRLASARNNEALADIIRAQITTLKKPL